MTEVILFHHVQGRTPGVVAFAEALSAAGHDVAVPDLFDGATFPTVEAGMAHVGEIGRRTVAERGAAAADAVPGPVVYAGMSLGVVRAQEFAQTRAGARGALLLHAGVPAEAFGGWPPGVALQVHVHADDPLGDVEDCRELVAGVEGAELFLYPGSSHLFTDASLPDHDAEQTALVLERSLAFLTRLA